MTPRPTTSDRRTLTRLVASIVAVLVLGLGSLLPAPARGSGGGLVRTGVWPQPFAGTLAALIPDEAGRQVISVENDPALRLSFWPESTFSDECLLGGACPEPATWESPYVAGAGAGSDPVVWLMEPDTRRLHLVVYPGVRQRQVPTLPRLLVLDLADGAAPRLVADRPLALFPEGVRILGLSLHQPSGALYAVGQGPATGVVNLRAYGVSVAEVALDTVVSGGDLPVLPTREPVPVRGCQRVIADTSPAAAVRVGDTLYVPCGPTTALDNAAPGPASVAAIPLADPVAGQRWYFLPGSYARGESFFDPAAGAQGRLLLVGSGLFRPGQAVWVFDIERRTMVGQIAADLIDSAGVDTTRGRIYMGVGQSLLVGSDRGVPLPQSLPPFGDVTTTRGRLTAVGFARAVILPVALDDRTAYAVFRDTTTDAQLPAARLTDFTALDARTTDSSNPSFAGQGQAFGVRLQHVGGVSNPKTNTDGGSQNWWNEPLLGLGPVPRQIAGVDDGSRNLQMARVVEASLRADEVSAAGISLDADERTRNDHVAATAQASGGEGQPWPFEEARCVVFGGGSQSAEGTDAGWDASPPPSTTCDKDSDRVQATASYSTLLQGGMVAVSAATAEATAQRGDSGIEVVSRAEARGITIGGQVTIGRAWSEARASAFGGHQDGPASVPGAGAVAYERGFDGVVTPDYSCTADCDPSEVAAAVSTALGAQVKVELPAAEVVASEGGTHSHAWREPWGLIEDVLVNEQSPTQQEIPALRLLVVGDADLPSRVVVDLAATQANATHIRTHPPGAVLPPLPPTVAGAAPVARPAPAAAGPGPLLPTAAAPVGADGALAAPAAGPTSVPTLVQHVVRQSAEWLVREPGTFLTLATLLVLFGTGPFLAARRRHLLRVGDRS